MNQDTADIIIGKTTRHLAQSGEYAGVLHKSVVEPFLDLVARASSAGFDLRIISGYRSFARQQKIWNAKVCGERPVLDDEDNKIEFFGLSDLDKIAAIMRFSAMPGASRHHWGTDIDVYDAASIDDEYQIQLIASETEKDGPFSELHRWLNSEIVKTEFYRPYEVDRGGVAKEPWHLSYMPLSKKYSRALTPEVILASHSGLKIELAESIKENIDVLFERFIQVESSSRLN